MFGYIEPSTSILEYIENERNIYEPDVQIFPPQYLMFRAFQLCPFENVKVVILGQDPYHGKEQANGLAFSVNNGMKLPPSLRNILKEYNDDLKTNRTDPDLADWAARGVLLLNSVLSVRESKPESHSKIGWQEYTDSIIKQINDRKENVIFLLWGNYAKSKEKLIDVSKHKVLKATHPSPLSANRGGWFGCKHFSQVNKLLKEQIF